MSNKKIQRNISRDFARLLDEIKRTRMKLDKELYPIPDWRITLAIFRHPKIKEIEEDIINADLR